MCVRMAGSGSRRTQETVTSWGAMTSQILALREHLVAEQVSCVVMGATGDWPHPPSAPVKGKGGVRLQAVSTFDKALSPDSACRAHSEPFHDRARGSIVDLRERYDWQAR